MANRKPIFPHRDPLLSAGKRVARLGEQAYEDVRDGAYLLGRSGRQIMEAPFRKVKNPWQDNAKKHLSSASALAGRGLRATGRGLVAAGKATGRAIRKGSKRAAPVVAKGFRGAASSLDRYATVANPPARKPPLRPMSKEDQESVTRGVNIAAQSWPSTIKVPTNTLMARKLMERGYKVTKKDPDHLSVPKFRLGWTVLSMIRGVDTADHHAADEIINFLQTKSSSPEKMRIGKLKAPKSKALAKTTAKPTAKKTSVKKKSSAKKKTSKKVYLPGM